GKYRNQIHVARSLRGILPELVRAIQSSNTRYTAAHPSRMDSQARPSDIHQYNACNSHKDPAATYLYFLLSASIRDSSESFPEKAMTPSSDSAAGYFSRSIQVPHISRGLFPVLVQYPRTLAPQTTQEIFSAFPQPARSAFPKALRDSRFPMRSA